MFLRRLGRQVVRTLRALNVMRQADAVDALSDQLQGERERGTLDELRDALLGEDGYFAVLTMHFDERWAAGLIGEIEGGEE